MMAAIDAKKKRDIVTFDAHTLEVIHIIVSYDMGWSRRSAGKAYDSSNGYGAIIGLLSGKVLEFSTRNRVCNKCKKVHHPSTHDCRKNYVGSAKAMEGDVAAELVNDKKSLKDTKIAVRAVIGDKDAVAIDKIRKGSKHKIFKFADRNHLGKNFMKKLYELRLKHAELRKKGVIKHIKQLFNFVVYQNERKTEALRDTLRAIPHHLFGSHKKCGLWCSSAKNSETDFKNFHAITFKSESLFADLSTLR